MRNFILLPRAHQLANLLLCHLRRKVGHCGYKSLMHEARRNFWIIGLKKMAKQLCHLLETAQKTPRSVNRHAVAAGLHPFTNTAIDMFGPLQTRLNKRTLQEAQVVIFTCRTSREIHLELVTDKTTEVFLTAFRRFASL